MLRSDGTGQGTGTNQGFHPVLMSNFLAVVASCEEIYAWCACWEGVQEDNEWKDKINLSTWSHGGQIADNVAQGELSFIEINAT